MSTVTGILPVNLSGTSDAKSVIWGILTPTLLWISTIFGNSSSGVPTWVILPCSNKITLSAYSAITSTSCSAIMTVNPSSWFIFLVTVKTSSFPMGSRLDVG